jgi:hypothetical protein
VERLDDTRDRAVESILPLLGDRACVLHPSRPPGAGGDSGGDVDCAVARIDLRWPTRLKGGWRLCQCLHYEVGGWYWVLERDGEILKLDTLDDPSGYGRYGFRTSLALKDPGVEVPPAVEAAYLTSKRLHKGIGSVDEWRRIGELARRSPQEYVALLETIFGRRWASSLSRLALAGRTPNSAFRLRIVTAHRLRQLARRTGAVWPVLAAGGRILERLRYPTGLVVLIVGPDGAGKSTLADSLEESCAGMFRRVERWHWRPDLLLNPSTMLGARTDDPNHPHAGQPHGRLLSLASLSYHWTDFFIGGWLKLSALRARSGLVLWERGWWDIAVDSRRYRLRVSPKLVRALGWFLVRPDLALVLEAPPDELLSRKNELGRTELLRQTAAWKHCLPSGITSISLDAGASQTSVSHQAREAIVEFLHRRGLQRRQPSFFNHGATR